MKFIGVQDELYFKYYSSDLDRDAELFENKINLYKEEKSFYIGVNFNIEHDFYTNKAEQSNITIVFKTNDACTANEAKQSKIFFNEFFSNFEYIYLKVNNRNLGAGCISFNENTGEISKHESYKEIYATKTDFFDSLAFFTIDGKLCDYSTKNQILNRCSGTKYIDQFINTLALHNLYDTSYHADMTHEEFDDFITSLYEIKDDENPHFTAKGVL